MTDPTDRKKGTEGSTVLLRTEPDAASQASTAKDPPGHGPAARSADAVADVADAALMMRELRRPASERMEREGWIASGGMASVEAALDRALMRRVAKKIIHPALQSEPRAVRMFLREARVNGVLDHPNIVPVHDIGEEQTPEGPRLYFTMKLVQGQPLSAIIRALPPGRIGPTMLFNLLDIAVKVCDALAFAHSRGVVHCDVKPANVMVGDFGQVYLMDWGVARLVGQAGAPGGSGEESAVVGTPGYMPPEQALGQRESLDARADVFAIGAILYEIVARRPPYRASDRGDVVKQAQERDLPPLHEACGDDALLHSLERIVMKAMSRHRSDRHPTAMALKEDLVRFMRGGEEFPPADFTKGTYIVREGDPGDTVYILVSGKCQVLKILDGTASVMHTLGPGDVFGEMSVLSEGPRTASVLAIEDTTVLVVTRAAFDEEIAKMKPWMASVLRLLASRFRELYVAKRVTHVGGPSPTRVARQVLMHLGTFGVQGPDGSLSMRWTDACAGIEAQLGAPIGMAIFGVTARYPTIVVDIDANLLRVRDPIALATALRPE